MKKQVLFIIMMLMPLMASASTNINGIYYNLNSTDKVAEVTYSSGTEYSGSIVIPETVAYGGVTYSVTSIGEGAFWGCSGLTSITIPNSVTTIIGTAYFAMCDNLVTIKVEDGNTIYDSRDNCNAVIKTADNELIAGCKNTFIPNSVTSIGESAFWGCSGLTSITIPNSVTSFGNSAFEACGLTSITIGNSVTSIGDRAFWGCSGLTSVTIGNSVTSIGNEAFLNCTSIEKITFHCQEIEPDFMMLMMESSLKEVIIGDEVKSIGERAFCGCSGLTSVTIGNSVTSIGEGAFWGCSGLTSVDIPNSVTSIGGEAFSGCSGLTSVTIGNSVTSIGEGAFSGCTGLKAVHITDLAAWCKINFHYDFVEYDYSDNPLFYAHHLFLNDEEVKVLIIPDGITSIKNVAFSGCSGLTSVTIGNSVTSIGEGAFWGCSGLTSITIPNSVTSIGNDAFSGCSGLTSVDIPNNVTSIGWLAFSGCDNIEEITFHCQEIGSWFSGMKSIKEIIIADEVKSIGESAFSGCSGLTSVTIGSSVTYIEEGAFSGCSGLKAVHITDLAAWCKINFHYDFVEFDYSDNPLFYAHHLYLNDEEVKELIIPDGITSIKNVAFHGCSGLTSVTIPNSVASIGNYAFYGCFGLTSVTIPNSVISIGWNAFSGCSGLTSVTIGNSVTSIGGCAFQGCSSLTSVTIPNSVTSISNNAFQGCSFLSSVSIGKGVKSIGSLAFANCPEIKEVYCYAKDVPTISNDTFKDSYYIKWATLYVPESSVDSYKASAWSQFGNIVGITGGNEGERCEKPTITLLANGKIKVQSATEGATCVTNISASTANPLTDEEISLSTPLIVYTVTAYATAEGYDDSEVATATFRFEGNKGDVDGDGKIDISDLTQLVNIILGQ